MINPKKLSTPNKSNIYVHDNSPDGTKSTYTIVSNNVLRNRKVKSSAKGLYALMCSFASIPDAYFSKDTFLNKSLEGKTAFESAWKNLKDVGYLKIHCYPSNGSWQYIFELLTVSVLGPHTYYYDHAGNLTSTNEKRIKTSTHSTPSKQTQDSNNLNTPDCSAIPDKTDDQHQKLNPLIIMEEEPMGYGDAFRIQILLNNTKKIDPAWCSDPEFALAVFKTIGGWNEALIDFDSDSEVIYALKAVICCLTEMCTTTQSQMYNNVLITSNDVIKQLNILTTKYGIWELTCFVRYCVDHFIAAAMNTEVISKYPYIKTIIWNCFASYPLDRSKGQK